MSVTVLGERRVGDGSIRKDGKELTYEETYEFRVVTDNKNTSRVQVLAASGIPRPGLTLSAGGFAVCRSTSAVRDEANPLYWTVTAEFSSEVQEDTSGANESLSGDPTAWIPIAQLGFETFTENSVDDASGTPYETSAKEPYANGIQLTRTLTKYDFEQFEPDSTEIDDIADRNETVNSVAFNGRDEKTLRLVVRSATIGFYYGYRVWRVAYTMTYKPDTWQIKILDRGSYYLAGGVITPFLDAQGNRYIGNLDGAGGAAAANTSAAVLTFDKYEAIDFNSFLRV